MDDAGKPMQNWNTVVTLYEEDGAYSRASRLLRQLGKVAPSPFHNVLVMRVEDVGRFLSEFSAMVDETPGILNDISRAIPAAEAFDFAGPDDFEARARAIALSWVPRLLRHSFYVRLHRRGLKGALLSPVEERFLDEALLSALEEASAPGKVRFEDPDFVIDIETVNNRAGMSLWTRDELQKYDFLRVD